MKTWDEIEYGMGQIKVRSDQWKKEGRGIFIDASRLISEARELNAHAEETGDFATAAKTTLLIAVADPIFKAMLGGGAD